jgi:hypothetical protein
VARKKAKREDQLPRSSFSSKTSANRFFFVAPSVTSPDVGEGIGSDMTMKSERFFLSNLLELDRILPRCQTKNKEGEKSGYKTSSSIARRSTDKGGAGIANTTSDTLMCSDSRGRRTFYGATELSRALIFTT